MSVVQQHPYGSEDLVERLAEREWGLDDSVVVAGPPGSGKSRLIDRLSVELGDRAVVLRRPEGEDAAQQLLAQALSAPVLAGDAELQALVSEPAVPFEAKAQEVFGVLRSNADQFVLLLDDAVDVRRWAPPQQWEGGGRLMLLLSELQSLRCPTLRTARAESADGHPDYLLAPFRARVADYVDARWLQLRPYVTEVEELIGARRLRPPHFKTLVLAALTGSLGQVVQLPLWRALTRVSEDVRHAIDVPGLSDVWQQLSLLRVPAAPETVDYLAEGYTASELVREAASLLLVGQDEHGVRMGELFRRQAERLRSPRDVRVHQMHAALADHYEQASGALSDEVELVHHLGRAMAVDRLISRSASFPEQLHDVGWWLSRHAHQYDAAAAIFRHAVQLDPQDAYAHHYLAFNLDVLGHEHQTVEASYARAIELDPYNAQARSRQVRFLIARGLVEEARSRFDEAVEQLEDQLEPDQPRFWQELHLDCARAFAAVGRYEHARALLEQIPLGLLESEPVLANALADATRMTLASDEDVVPAWRDPERWHLQAAPLPEVTDSGALQAWWAARVAAVDDDDVYLDVSMVDGDRRSDLRLKRLDRETFEEAADWAVEPREGLYVRLGFYEADDASPVLVEDSRPDDYEPLETRAWPDPLRYVRARVAATHQ